MHVQAVENALMPLFQRAVGEAGLTGRMKFMHIRRLYAKYKYSDLTKHCAIVLVPYQVTKALPTRSLAT